MLLYPYGPFLICLLLFTDSATMYTKATSIKIFSLRPNQNKPVCNDGATLPLGATSVLPNDSEST